MSQKEIDILKRALQREKKARKTAEKILEEKSRILYNTSNELQESNKKLKTLLGQKSSELKGVFENIGDAYVLMNLYGDVIKLNEEATLMFGYDINIEPLNVTNLVYKEDYEYAMTSFFSLKRNGYFKDYKARVITKNGLVKWVQINASIIYNDYEKPIAAHGIVRDITKEVQLKKELQEEKHKLDIIINNSPIGISLSRVRDEGLLLINSSLCQMLGYEFSEFQDMQVHDITHPEDQARSTALRKQLIGGEIDHFSLEKRYLKKNGGILWAKTTVTAVRKQKGEITYQVATVADISDERFAKEQLIESENRLASLITNLDRGVLLENKDREIILTNPKFCELMHINKTPEELIGMNCMDAAAQNKVLFSDQDAFLKRVEEIDLSKKTVLGDELFMLDGTVLERDYIPIYNQSEITGYLWTFNDITLEKKYKQSLEAQKEKYGSIIANMNLGLLEVNNDDEILMVNQSFLDMCGYTEEELIGQKGKELFLYKDDQRIIENENKKRLKGESNSYEIKSRDKFGRLKYWLISGAPNYNLNGEVIGSIGVHLDITELKSLQLQKEKILAELEKSNNELNEYAHIVSHDLKSPLRSIEALVSWIKSDNLGKFDATTVQNFQLIEDTLETMEQLISDILEYSRIGARTDVIEDADLNSVMESIKRLLYIPENVTLKIQENLPTLKGDRTKFQQLFQNLISNAIKFCDKEDGLVELKFAEKKQYYQFSIKDNGIGIEKQFHDKIFKIFHSLNKSKDSTGIGLSIVKKIVDLYKGNIWLESEPGKGTTFFFSIKKQ